jgi:hypothetical protein
VTKLLVQVEGRLAETGKEAAGLDWGLIKDQDVPRWEKSDQ